MSAVLDRRAIVDGAWWPYSRNAAAELPGLIAAVDQRLGRTTLSVRVYPDAWDHIPRRIATRGRQVTVSWLGQADPRVVTLGFARAEPVVLLVIPAGTASGPADAALTLAIQGATGLAAGLPTGAPFLARPGSGADQEDDVPGRENESRRVID